MFLSRSEYGTLILATTLLPEHMLIRLLQTAPCHRSRPKGVSSRVSSAALLKYSRPMSDTYIAKQSNTLSKRSKYALRP